MTAFLTLLARNRLALAGLAEPLDGLLRAAFNVVSVVTTTGFATEDYTAWGAGPVVVFDETHAEALRYAERALGVVRRTHFHTMAMYANLLQPRVVGADVESDRLTQGESSVAMVDAIAARNA